MRRSRGQRRGLSRRVRPLAGANDKPGHIAEHKVAACDRQPTFGSQAAAKWLTAASARRKVLRGGLVCTLIVHRRFILPHSRLAY
jgi:hypothetical protein